MNILGSKEDEFLRFMDAPVNKAGLTPRLPSFEKADLFDTFCDAWKLNNATATWLTQLEPEVQSIVFEDFDESHCII